jgi:hypothetical protein
MLCRLRLWLLAILIASQPAISQMLQGTAFTYQGLIQQGGVPVAGQVDIVFRLFDSPSAGNTIGPSVEFTAANGNPMQIQDGVFNAALDFGALAFNGPTTDQRFLEISVNGSVLTPRTPMLNSPYALQSRTAELAYTVSNGSIGSAQVDATQVQRRISGFCTIGSSVRSVNQDGTVICQQDANSGGTITAVSTGPGLSGGGSSGNVLLDVANPLSLSGATANGVVQATNSGTGYAVQGTSNAGTAVYGSGSTGVQGTTGSATGKGVVGYANAMVGETVGIYGQADSSGGHGVGGYSPSGTAVYALSLSGYGMQAISAGNSGLVALGNDAPVPIVSASFGVLASSMDANGAGIFGISPVPSGTGVQG